ncbi:hypothetical protein ZWY2020_039537 [Hordeum vulgare]|nr:hypothetical protein ZWY2020_039537 [Hordeum vulgare]
MPLSRRDGLMCEYNDDFNHLQCFSNVMLDKEEIDNIVKKLCGESLETCSKIGLKPFCLSNPAPEKNSPFWKRKLKTAVRKVPTNTAPKKRTKGKAAKIESSVVGESRAAEEHSEGDDMESQDEDVEKVGYTPKHHTRSHSGDLLSGLLEKTAGRKRQSEVSPPSSGNSAASALPPLIRLQGSQAKKRKTVESSSNPKATEKVGISTSIPETHNESVEPHTEPPDDLRDIQDKPPSPQKEVAENLNPPSPQKAVEDLTPDPKSLLLELAILNLHPQC